MSPRIIFLLTLAGVLLVGLPLPILTRSAEKQQAPTSANAVKMETVWAVISFTGTPLNLRLRKVGGNWQDVDCSASGVELELELPIRGTVEIELQAEWKEPDVQAISLSLEPPGQDGKEETQWKEEGSRTLHNIFTFRW